MSEANNNIYSRLVRHYHSLGLTSAVDETIPSVSIITDTEVAPNSVVTVRIREAHGQIEIALINICKSVPSFPLNLY